MRFTRVAAALSVLMAAGCASTSTTVMDQSRVRPAITPEQVVIYRTADTVPNKYEEIALLNSSGNTEFGTVNTMMNSMRKEAAKVGANGIILDAMSEPGTGAKIAGAIFGTGAHRTGKAVAIYVYPAGQ